MSVDIASLGLEIDSTQVVSGKDALDQFRDSATGVADATDKAQEHIDAFAQSSIRAEEAIKRASAASNAQVESTAQAAKQVAELTAQREAQINTQGRLTEEEARYWAMRWQATDKARVAAETERVALDKTRGALADVKTTLETVSQSTGKATDANEKWITGLTRAALAQRLSKEEMLATEAATRHLTAAQEESITAIIKYRQETEALKQAQKTSDSGSGPKESPNFFDTSNLLKAGTVLELVHLGIEKIIGVVKEAVVSFIAWEDAQSRLQAMLKVTDGVVGRTSEQINQMAEGIRKSSTFDDTSIVKAATSLLKFGDLTGTLFDRALKSSADLAAIMGTDITQAAELVGRSLENSFGVASLRRMGLLTDAQVEYLKVLKEASGDQEYQNELLTILEAKSKGAAAELGNNGLGGAWQQFSNQLEHSREQTGKTISDLLGLEETVRHLTDLLQRFEKRGVLGILFNESELGLIDRANKWLDEHIPKIEYLVRLLTPGVGLEMGHAQQSSPGEADSSLASSQAAITNAQREKETTEALTKVLKERVGVVNDLTKAYEKSLPVAEQREQAEDRFRNAFAAGTKGIFEMVDKYGSVSKAMEVYVASQVKVRGGTDQVKAAFAALDKELVLSQVAFDDIGKNATNKMTPALKNLIAFVDDGNKVWAKMSEAQKQAYIDTALTIDGQQKLNASLIESAKNVAASEKTVEDYSDSLTKQTEKLAAESAAILKYGFANAGSAQATLDFALAHGKLHDALEQLEKQFPGITESWTKILKAEADATDAARDYNKAVAEQAKSINDAVNAADKSNEAMHKQAETLREQTKELGLTKEQLDQVRIGNTDVALAVTERDLAEQRANDGSETTIKYLEDKAAALRDYRDAQRGLLDKQVQVDADKMWGDVFKNAADYGAKFLEDFASGSHKSFSDIAHDLLTQLLAAMAKFLAQKFIISIAGMISPQLGGIAQQALGGNSPFGNLFNSGGSGGGSNFIGSAVGNFAGSSVGQGLGLSAPVGGSAGIAADAVGGIPGGVAADVALTGTGQALVGAAATVIPYVGLAIAAVTLISSFLSRAHGPKVQGEYLGGYDAAGIAGASEVAGGANIIGITGDNTSAADAKAFGQSAATTFYSTLKTLGGTTGGIQIGVGYSTDPKGTAPSFVHTVVRDASGGEIFKQSNDNVARDDASLKAEITLQASRAVLAALQQSDLPKYIADILNSVDAATASQDAINNIEATAIALADAVKIFSDSLDVGFSALGNTLKSLDVEQIKALVGAFGGAKEFADAMTYIAANFTTSEAQFSQTKKLLTDDFTDLGLAVPATHEGFVQLINSLITAGDPELAAKVAKLGPLFVAVAGTADQAAQRLASAQAIFNADRPGASPLLEILTKGDSAIAIAQIGELGQSLHKLGVEQIPTTTKGIRDLYDSIPPTTEANIGLRNSLVLLYPEILNVENAFKQARDAFHSDDAFFTPQEQAAQRRIDDVNAITAAEDKLHITIPRTLEGFRATLVYYENLGEAGRATLAILYPLIPAIKDYNAALKEQSTIIQSVGSIIKVSTDAATKLLSQYAALADQSTGGFGDKLAIQIALINDAVANVDRADFTSTTAFNAYVGKLKTSAANLTAELANFTILSAQYDAARAEQLVGLQQWYSDQFHIFGGDTAFNKNVAALDALKTIFDQKWNAIVNGAAAATEALDVFISKIKQFADSTRGNAGQQAQLELALSTAKLAELQRQLTAAQTGQSVVTQPVATATPTSTPIATAPISTSPYYTQPVAAPTLSPYLQQLALAQGATTSTVTPVPTTTTPPPVPTTTTTVNPALAAIQTQIDTLKTYNADLAVQIEHFTAYQAQYGTAVANQLIDLENQYKEWQTQAAGNADALAVLATIYNEQRQAIIDSLNGIGSALEDFVARIKQLADSTGGNAGQQARLEMALSLTKIDELTIAYRALNDPASAQAALLYTQILKLRAYNEDLAMQLAHFTTYAAQYGTDAANQLVELENWYKEQQKAITDAGGNADALAILAEIFQDHWKAIIDGLKGGVDASIAELARLKQSIAEYLKGLFVSALSPLTPQQQLETARTALDAEIALAQKNDPKALGDVTQYLDRFLQIDRDVNASNAQFTADFNKYTTLLGAIAGTSETGQPIDAVSALTSALPTNSTLASATDVAQVTSAVKALDVSGVVDQSTTSSTVTNVVNTQIAAAVVPPVSTTTQPTNIASPIVEALATASDLIVAGLSSTSAAIVGALGQLIAALAVEKVTVPVSNGTTIDDTTINNISNVTTSTTTSVVDNSVQNLSTSINELKTSIDNSVSSATEIHNAIENLSNTVTNVVNHIAAATTATSPEPLVAEHLITITGPIVDSLAILKTAIVDCVNSAAARVVLAFALAKDVTTVPTAGNVTTNVNNTTHLSEPTSILNQYPAITEPIAGREDNLEIAISVALEKMSASVTQALLNVPATDKSSLIAALPSKQPTTSAESSATIVSTLPTSGKLASDENLRSEFTALKQVLIELTEQLVAANKGDSETQTAILKQAIVVLTEEVGTL